MKKYNSRSEVPDKYKWDLSDFYKNDEEFDKELEETKKLISKYKEYVNCTKDSKKLYEFLTFDNKVCCNVENLYAYSYLKNDEDLSVAKGVERKNRALNLYTSYVNAISFFNPELLSLSKEEYDKLFDNKDLLEFKFLLDEIYKTKDHILSEREEQIINELESAMNNFDDISSTMLNSEHNYGTVLVDGEEVPIRQTNLRVLLKNKDAKIRKEAYDKFKSKVDQYGQTAASLLDSYVKANNTNAKLHHFDSAWDRKLFDYNMVNDSYNALITAVEAGIPYLQRYYDLRKKELGLKELHDYDLSLDISDFDKKYTIEEACELTREAIKPLGEEYLKCYDKIIDNHYIDFCEYKGKCSGGYNYATFDHDSRILLSFNEDLDSVSTIAHECGHNVHHQFVTANNDVHYRNITSLVSEVVSLTNECLLSDYLANNGKTKEEKLAGLDNILGVIESNLYGAVREGKLEQDFYKYSLEGNTLTKDYMKEIDLNSRKKYYGDKVIISEYANTGWITRSHYYMNYYLFNYSFCISIALYISSKLLKGDKDALNKYIKFISLGSDVYPKDAFKVLGIDITNKKVYEEAVSYFNSLLDKYEEISKEV